MDRRLCLPALLLALVGCKEKPEAPVGQRYAVRVEPGSPTAVRVTPGAGWKMNLEYPNRLVARSSPGGAALQLGPEKAKVTEEEVSFEVASRAGESYEGTVSFAICNPRTCIPITAPVAWGGAGAPTPGPPR